MSKRASTNREYGRGTAIAGAFGVSAYRGGKRLWNPEDDDLVRWCYADEPTTELARVLRRTVRSVYVRAKQFGLRKSAAYLASPAACRLRRPNGPDHPGFRTQFKKGQVPLNKGVRRPGWFRGRMRETQFKKGERSGVAASRWMPIGSTRLIEGYVYRKVSDVPNVPYTVNWKAEHHLLWTQAHGPIPPGHRLRFTNGNPQDVRLDNLELVTPRQMMTRNSIHNLPPALKSTIQLLGALNRQIRKREGHGNQEQDRRSA
jgi:HNH endonuclease